MPEPHARMKEVSAVARPRPAERIWYGWGLFVLTVATAACGAAYLVHQTFNHDPDVWTRWSRRWARAIGFGIGLRVRASYDPSLPADRPCIYVSNHQSAVDILVHLLTMPVRFGFLAKAELARAPVLGACLRHSHCLFVDRSSPRRARESLVETARRIRSGTSVLIYPEGERTHRREMAAFRRGAFVLAEEAGAPIVPVTLLDAYRVCDFSRRRLRPGTVSVHYGAPIESATCPADGGETLRERARQAIAAQLQQVTKYE